MMPAQDWLLIICLGGLAGALGQLARVIVGLKKAQDEAAGSGASLKAVFETSRMVVSIALGFTAGALAAVTVKPSVGSIPTETIIAFAAAGYSGADFIEGLMSKQLAKITGGGAQGAGGQAAAPAAAANAPADTYAG